MTRFAAACFCALIFLASTINAEARQRHKATTACVETGTIFRPSCNGPQVGAFAPAPMSRADQREARRVARGEEIARQMGIGGVAPRPAARVPKALHGASKEIGLWPNEYGHNSQVLASKEITPSGIVAPLAAKVAEIQASCGSKVISAVRHTYIAGTRHISLHASGQAVDVQGNPGCIYGMLHNWPGGYSIDYGRMNHVHISWGGPEQGLRFAHGGGHRHARRYARHRHPRYAAAAGR